MGMMKVGGGGGMMEVGSGYDGSGKWVWWKWEVGMVEVGSGYGGSGEYDGSGGREGVWIN